MYLCIAAILFATYSLNERVGINDWQKEIAYFQYIHKSLLSFHTIPYIWWNKLDNVAGYPSVSHTSNFISNPETLLFSPFTPMLLLLNEIHYIKFLAVVHFLIGVIGLLVVRKQLQWSDLQFRTYAILFLFSPVIIQHLADGYTPWLNLFFFPWLIYFVAHKDKLLGTLGMSLILSWVLLQGGAHPFVWFASFVFFYFVSSAYLQRNWSCLVQLPFIFGIVFCLSLIRLYATAQAYSDFHQSFQIGYNPLNFLLYAVIPPLLVPPFHIFFTRIIWLGVPSWDGGIFWGASLPMLATLLIKYRNYRKQEDIGHCEKPNTLDFDSILLSSSILFIAAFFSSFELLVKGINSIVYIPFSEGVEKYPFRLAIPAFLGYSVVIANFSQNIWQDMHAWIIERRPLVYFKAKVGRVLSYSCLVIVLVCFLTLAVSFSFSHTILKFFDGIVTEAYHGTGSQWLSRFMGGIDKNPPEYYLNVVHSQYQQTQRGLVVVGVFSVLIYLMMRERARLWKFFEGFSYIKYEGALAIPLLFSNVMWLLLATSTPYRDFLTQDVVPPKIVTQSGFSQPNVLVTPKTLTIFPRNPVPKEYILPNILFSDAKSFDVVSGNATLSPSAIGRLSIISESANGSVVQLEFNSKNYDSALIFTIISWTVVVVCFMLRRRLTRAVKQRG